MIRSSRLNIRNFIIGILLFSGVISPSYSQEKQIGGVINQYRQVVAIGGVPDNVTVTNADIFAAGDTVLLIQMKGVVMLGSETSEYGAYQYSMGSPGGYEFLIVQSVNNGTGNVVFTRRLVKTYDLAGLIQLIKVPFYDSARVTAELTCQPWDSVTAKTGGVLALIVGGTLTLDAGINVTGKGFLGGAAQTGQGLCVSLNTALYDKYAYPDTYTNSGYKGEGLVTRAYLSAGNIPSIYPDYAKGKGANFTGGGGGNGRFSGGAGGANIGSGGNGGRENGTCTPPADGGSVGKQVLNTDLEGSILLGGGGGSSTYATGTASAGGRGGGIIIIVTDILKSNSSATIAAEGAAAAASAGAEAGAGGGGGGGSIALCQRNFSVNPPTTTLRISANGGNGGSSFFNNGEGGGGGGGLILTNSTVPAAVATTFAGGSRGVRNNGSSSGIIVSKPGENLTNFKPVLNGFLFNIIRSSRTNNQYDSVCSNVRPHRISGTIPVGGTSPYTFRWESSFDISFSSPNVLINNSPDSVNYTPTLADIITPTDTVWFRRVIQDAGTPLITDISKPVKILVQHAISNNIVGISDTVCFNGDPPLISQVSPPDLICPTAYVYFKWQDSTAVHTWGPALGTGKNFDPAAGLTATTWYRRVVTSGSCIDSAARVRMTVLPLITGNMVFPPADDSICSGTPFGEITGTRATGSNPLLDGGDKVYRFLWESNNNFTGWVTASGISDRDSLDPAGLPQRIPENYYRFRRIVFSGRNNVCSDTSTIVELRDFPVITNNTVFTSGPNLPVCSGSAPVMITGNPPNNGNGLFTWQDSTNSVTGWKDIPGFAKAAAADFQPPPLTITTGYRRIAHSSGCTSTSNAIEITVIAPIANNSVSLASLAPDTIVCTGTVSLSLAGSTNPTGGAGGPYSYQWLHATPSTGFTDIAGADQPLYNPPPLDLNITTFYKRIVTDMQDVCRDTSTTMITVNVLAPVSNNTISTDRTTVCENTAPAPVTGSSPSGGSGTYLFRWEQSTDGGSNWSLITGETAPIYQPPVLTDPVKYRRTVISGLADCCMSVSPELEIAINPAPDSPVNAGADESIFSIDKSYNLNADPAVVQGESGFWTATGGSAIVVSSSDSKSQVKNLSSGKNLFIWTITNGLCDIADSVYLDVQADFYPQGFSPNGDAFNNTFIIKGLNLNSRKIAELSILNSAGTLVFSTTNRDGSNWVDWDGKNNKGVELPDGTYYYLFKLTTEDNALIKKSGFIELKRR